MNARMPNAVAYIGISLAFDCFYNCTLEKTLALKESEQCGVKESKIIRNPHNENKSLKVKFVST